ncbi:hypothetical protein [Tepidibacter hydrothermalis]|uniref:Leucine-rich repeat domain-containing protein n=1 Tax=Tepidibacter hydrothermalis TaxID=3036126 RepID=A0ABY8EDR1_9FIRM|nr:hypothetical protein [Tepidibacter hydrothermalis]WFD11077.1 hypothetical protein P4S50_03100 [Tepidibacter hydrothermalis]
MRHIKTSKKDIFGFTMMVIVFMIVHLFYENLLLDGELSGIWIGLLIVGVIGELIKESRDYIYKRILIRCSIPIIMILNYVLFRFSIHIPNYIVFFTILCIYIIIIYRTSFDRYKMIFSIGIISLLLLFFCTDYYIKSNNIIKDINFRRYISKEYGIKGKIEPSDLENIEKLSIDVSDINSIKGIEYFKNLKELYIHDAYKINDFSWMPQLNKLNYLMLWYMDLDDLESIEELRSLEHLEIVYPKYGELENLKNFSNLKELDIQGIDYMENLNCIKGPKNIKRLGLGDSQIVVFDGIEEFEKIEELSLYKISSTDVSKIFELKNLKKVVMESCNIYKQDEFIQNLKADGIQVEIIEPPKIPLFEE